MNTAVLSSPKTPTSDLRIGVLGLGWMGATRAGLLARLPGFHLVGCADTSPLAASHAPAGVPVVATLEELIDLGIEALVVSTPDRLHRDPTVRALVAGIHVFCEKPLASTLADADDMIEAERASLAQLVVGQTLRANPRYRALRAKVQSGELGAGIHATSRRSWPAPEGARHTAQTTLAQYLSIHELDALQWVLGQSIVRVYAEQTATRLAGFGDGAASLVATLRFADGSVASHECTWGLPDSAGMVLGDCSMSVIGSEGSAYLVERDHGVTVYGGTRDIPQPESTRDELFLVRGAIEIPEATDDLTGQLGTPYAAELLAFLGAVRGTRDPIVSSVEARSALAAVLALEESLATGLPVTVEHGVFA